MKLISTVYMYITNTTIAHIPYVAHIFVYNDTCVWMRLKCVDVNVCACVRMRVRDRVFASELVRNE